MSRVEEMIRTLPAELQQEVEAFVRALLESRAQSSNGGFSLDWRGELRDLRDQFDSVQLQHQARDTWGR